MRTLIVADGVHTLATPETARALLVDNERIAWVGSDAADAPPADRSVDLTGTWITPAFVDAHVHATATGLLLAGLDLSGAASAAELLDRLRRFAAETADPVVLGARWDDHGWPERRPPSADELSDAAGGRSVLLTRVDAHSCLVDSRTLGALPLGALEGVHRDAGGRPTGLLAEQASEAATRLIYDGLSSAQLASARMAACRRALELGIASLHEMGHPGLAGRDDALAWATGEWPLEVLVWWAELDVDNAVDAGLRPGGDLFLDGSIGSRTAAVGGGYRDADPPRDGTLFCDDEDVVGFFDAATRRGAGAGVHAIGDRAIEQAVRALETVAQRRGPAAVRRCRHRIEHLELPRPDHPVRLARLAVVASVQPMFDAQWGGGSGLYAERLGIAAAGASNPFALLARAGVALAFGSDSPVTPLDPWGGVVAAEQHRRGQGLCRRDALAASTLGGRYAAGQDEVGALRAGARADFAAWSADPLVIDDPNRLICQATVVRGRIAHRGGGLYAA